MDELPPQGPATHPATILSLFRVCFGIGLFSFGGGLTAWMHREVVAKRRWLTDDDFMNGVALAQVLPGTNVTNLIVYIGQRLLGARGAAVALFGLLVGPLCVVIALVTLYDTYAGLDFLHRALDGAAAVAIGLMVVMAVKGSRRAARSVVSGLVMAAIVVCVGVLQWPMLPVVVVLALVSVAAAFARTAR